LYICVCLLSQPMTLCSLYLFLAGLRKSYSADLHKIRQNSGTWAIEETVRFWWKSGSCYVRVSTQKLYRSVGVHLTWFSLLGNIVVARVVDCSIGVRTVRANCRTQATDRACGAAAAAEVRSASPMSRISSPYSC